MCPLNGAGERPAERRALLAAIAMAATTSAHHVYGAIVYHTPWRYDAVVISGITIMVMMAALRLSRSVTGATVKRAAWWTFWGVNAAVFVLILGAFEGLYNHAIKDLLYFGGAPLSVMRALFPAPKYELPNDWFFEVTGVLQVIVAATAAIQLVKLLPDRPRHVASARAAVGTALTQGLAAAALWTIRLTGPVQVAVGIAFWMGRAPSLRPAHMLLGVIFDLALLSLVVMAAARRIGRSLVVASATLVLAIPLFGVAQTRILPGPEHWVVRSAHLLLALIAMVAAARLARLLGSATMEVTRGTSARSADLPHATSGSRVAG